MQTPLTHSAACSSEEYEHPQCRLIGTKLEALLGSANLLQSFGRNTQFQSGISIADLVDHYHRCCSHDLDNMVDEAMAYIRARSPISLAIATAEREARQEVTAYRMSADQRRSNRLMSEQIDRERAQKEARDKLLLKVGGAALAGAYLLTRK